MNLTAAQEKAISASGNILMVAGAGTGKTRTLVERCLRCLLDEAGPAGLDELLVVTFTEAAAAEMRQRIRARLEESLRASPHDRRIEEQMALFETAHIGTLHGFCLQLARRHFYQLELDPQFSVTTEEEANALALEELDDLLREHYSGTSEDSAAIQQLITTQGDGSDQPIRALVLRLHTYSQTLPDPSGWYAAQIKKFSKPIPSDWNEWLLEALADFRQRWAARLNRIATFNGLAAESLELLKQLPARPGRTEAAPLLPRILATSEHCPKGKKGAWLDPLEDFYEEAQFLLSLAAVSTKPVAPADEADPLVQDWKWVQDQITTILKLARQFGQRFSRAKRELALVDFHDLEQYALQLLWDHQANRPTRTAEEWQKRFRYVLVDEYQDINAAQDKILQALSRPEAGANRFLVGDVKQSIYRFRLAAPHIFQGYVKDWGKGAGAVIPLVENFRSREGILKFVNSLFEQLMKEEVGGIAYGNDARLVFGAATERQALSSKAAGTPPVEFHLRIKRRAQRADSIEAVTEEMAEVNELEEASKEARLAGMRLRELKAAKLPVWDEESKEFRPVDWKDMAILLRSPSNKAEFYAREFSRLNVPLTVARGGFYESAEISDLLSLLRILDNPLQDVPLLAVLHSPMVGLTLDEMASVRLATKGRYWTALLRFQAQETAGSAPAKISRFLERFARWRRLARHLSLSGCLESVLAETHYAEWLLTQARGEQRHANLQRLLGVAQRFDQFQRQGLFRFLRFIEAQQTAEAEPPAQAGAEENAVRLMSIHQSKGLEFPVVVIADTGKAFNLSDLRSDLLLDEVYGICPQIKPPGTGKRYPSLPCWLARRRQRNEVLGEELRLLYVAMTRARDLLVITGNVSEARLDKLWSQGGDDFADPVETANSVADWLGVWFSGHARIGEGQASQGVTELLSWNLHDDAKLLVPAAEIVTGPPPRDPLLPADGASWRRLQMKLSWKYPYLATASKPAKTSVSVLRRGATAREDEAAPYFQLEKPRRRIRKVSGTDIGSATHKFLQLASVEGLGSVENLKAEASRLVQAKALTAEEMRMIHFGDLATFWQSELGESIRANLGSVHRELAFTARFSLQEVNAALGEPLEAAVSEDFIVVQGVADLVVLLPEEIRVLDFKTDNVPASRLAEKIKQYEPQLRLYNLALSRIYRRPVSECWLYFLSLGKGVRVEEELSRNGGSPHSRPVSGKG